MVSPRILALAPLLWGCDIECEAPMTESEDGLVVTYAEHPTGWGEDNCSACHVPAITHESSCDETLDLEAVRETVAAEGDASCADCHGDNGVSP